MKTIYRTRNGYCYNFYNNKMFYPTEKLYQFIEQIESKEILNKLYKEEKISKDLHGKLLDILFGISNKKNIEKYIKRLNKLQLIVTKGCNMRCKYCYAGDGLYGEEFSLMTFEVAKRAIDFFFEEYDFIENITFFGGEPCLNINVIEKICLYVQENYPQRYKNFLMMSNLYLLNEQIIRTIKEYRIKVTTSLDGDKVCNDENRIDILGNGTFEQVSRNIKKLQEITGEPSAIEATLSGIHNKTSVSRFDVVDFLGSQFDVKFCSAIEVCDFNESGVEVFRENHMLNEQIREEIQLYIQKGVVTDKVKDFFSVIHGIFENDYWCDAGIT